MKILAAVAVIVIFFLMGQFRFLAVAGINPNLLLVGLLFFGFKAERFRSLGILLATSVVLAVLFTPTWLFQFAALMFIVLFFYLMKDLMTGSRFFDFLIAVLAGTLLFYLIASPFRFELGFYALVLWEVVYNLIMGLLMFYVAQKITNRPR